MSKCGHTPHYIGGSSYSKRWDIRQRTILVLNLTTPTATALLAVTTYSQTTLKPKPIPLNPVTKSLTRVHEDQLDPL